MATLAFFLMGGGSASQLLTVVISAVGVAFSLHVALSSERFYFGKHGGGEPMPRWLGRFLFFLMAVFFGYTLAITALGDGRASATAVDMIRWAIWGVFVLVTACWLYLRLIRRKL